MATYYVVCVVRRSVQTDPYGRIVRIGTAEADGLNGASRVWLIEEVVEAIDRGRDTFWSSDGKGVLARCFVTEHEGRKYVRTEADGIEPDNLLAKRECDVGAKGPERPVALRLLRGSSDVARSAARPRP